MVCNSRALDIVCCQHRYIGHRARARGPRSDHIDVDGHVCTVGLFTAHTSGAPGPPGLARVRAALPTSYRFTVHY